MLELRPNCECCDKDLPPASTEACICSYECTFCRDCVDTILFNVCPNCGGGFVPRPVRPAHAYRDGVSTDFDTPSTTRKHLKYTRDQIAEFSDRIKAIPATER